MLCESNSQPVVKGGQRWATATGVVWWEPVSPDGESEWSSHTTLQGGVQEIDGLAAGTYEVSLTLRDEKKTREQRVTLATGERRVIEFVVAD